MTPAAAPARVAAVQMVSGPDVPANLAAAADLLARAAGEGAALAALPEFFAIMGLSEHDKVGVRERDGEGRIQDFLATSAARLRMWVVGGSVPIQCEAADKVRNACLVYDDRGRRVARYDKIHLFGFRSGAEQYEEARSIEPGERVVVVDSPFGRLGLSICYDLRFPELYRAMQGADVLMVPSAFTATTGAAHWETLVRARAIENLAWVVAPAQGGLHANGRRTHGDSMIVDPWGRVLARLATGAGVVVAEIDPRETARLRASLPALDHRTLRLRADTAAPYTREV